MPTDFRIDYNAIIEYLKKEDLDNPERTHSIIDLFIENTNTVLNLLVNGDETVGRSIWVTLDEWLKRATIFGDEINLTKDMKLVTLSFMKNKPISEQLYLLFDWVIKFESDKLQCVSIIKQG